MKSQFQFKTIINKVEEDCIDKERVEDSLYLEITEDSINIKKVEDNFLSQIGDDTLFPEKVDDTLLSKKLEGSIFQNVKDDMLRIYLPKYFEISEIEELKQKVTQLTESKEQLDFKNQKLAEEKERLESRNQKLEEETLVAIVKFKVLSREVDKVLNHIERLAAELAKFD